MHDPHRDQVLALIVGVLVVVFIAWLWSYAEKIDDHADD